MRSCFLLFIAWIFVLKAKLVYSFSANEKDKIVLISAEYVLYDVISSPDVNFSNFRRFINESCSLNEIVFDKFSYSSDVHFALLSGGFYHTKTFNISRSIKCDQIILSKISPSFEPLWLTNQRQGFKSGSFYWPDDFLSVNKSRPTFSAGYNPTPRKAYFDTEMIHRWLSNPSITFMSIFIPPPPVLSDSDFLYSYIEYADSFLASLLSTIKNSPKLNSSVSIIFIGGTAVIDELKDFDIVSIRKRFEKWPMSAFGNYFRRASVLEFWPTPDELMEEDYRLLNEQNPEYFVCDTEEFRKRNPGLDTGLLPPYYLVAKPGKVLQVFSDSYKSEKTLMPQSSPFVLLWGKAFTKSPEVCGVRGTDSNVSNHPIQLYDIYPMVCWVLGLQRPWVNMGELSRIKKYFKNQPSDTQVAEFASRCRDWGQLEEGKFGLSISTLFAGGLIAVIALIFAVTFIACALRYHCRYSSLHPVTQNMPNVRYHKRRLQRPWLGSSKGSDSRSHRGLLTNHQEGSGFALVESEEEEVLIDNDILSARESRKRQQESADAYIQMLHSPTGNRSAPSLPHA